MAPALSGGSERIYDASYYEGEGDGHGGRFYAVPLEAHGRRPRDRCPSRSGNDILLHVASSAKLYPHENTTALSLRFGMRSNGREAELSQSSECLGLSVEVFCLRRRNI